MLRSKIFICILLIGKSVTFLCNTDSTKKSEKHRLGMNNFIDVNAGPGKFILGNPLNSETEKLSGEFAFSRPLNAGVSFGKNFSETKSVKRHLISYLGIGCGLNFMTYDVKHGFDNYTSYST